MLNKQNLMRLLRLAPALLFLTACQTVRPSTVVRCPSVIPYTAAQEMVVHEEYVELPATSELRHWIDDYVAERDVLRACAAPAGVVK